MWWGRDGGDVDYGRFGEGEETGVKGGAEAVGDGGVPVGESGGVFLGADGVDVAGSFGGRDVFGVGGGGGHVGA